MIRRTELISLHIMDLLEMLEASPGEGSLCLLVDGQEHTEVDFDDLCLVVRIEGGHDEASANIIPLRK